MIHIAKPIIEEEEILHVQEIMKSGMIACGETVSDFERKFAESMKANYAVATSSGTTALHAAVIASGILPGDKVITTPFTFAATANSLLFQQAIPVFADIEPDTFNIDPHSIEKILEKNRDTRALLIVHLFGLPCNMEKIMEIVEKYRLILIEDCAQAHGAKYNEKTVGNFGITAAFSFYPTKNMTTGEGGIILTNDRQVYEHLKKLINHGQQERYLHTMLGYNFRMTNIAAAIGIEQLKKLEDFNHKRIANAQIYTSTIKNEAVILPWVPANCHHVYHQYTIKVSNREKFIRHLKNHGIEWGIYYPIPLNAQPYYRQLGYDPLETPVALKTSSEVVSIPVHPGLTPEEIYHIIEVINHYE
ncbi:DegT/DnrJ/EryC1/StrS family aminotransferase [Thermotalea metallivorans]|uniref:dTDP-3-amino-3,6-dideoxy-alpha-D-galactopyranose transaminase n=1 Tax=Thermotalea metallivorans TaxID=520762 RepID=A0A140L4H7_9FIRM|nr:DegT/DnrJ/EryC1/StrS family aminotransferase [Thermotalea metallivorans]KXG75452.1 dTDP-3-amino-3,6-dideoxy-alpha-D-galactopyranose transaminase [Thermotalea metallivorans]